MNRSFQVSQAFSILIIGIGIGWLAGLSISSVVGGIITSLLGIGAGIVTGLQTIRPQKGENQNGSKKQVVDARPAAILVLGIALSSPCGIMARTYHVFEPRQHQNSSERKPQDQGVLFAEYQDECEQILGLATMGNYKAFLEQLKASNIPVAKELVPKFQHEPGKLRQLVKIICQDREKK